MNLFSELQPYLIKNIKKYIVAFVLTIISTSLIMTMPQIISLIVNEFNSNTISSSSLLRMMVIAISLQSFIFVLNYFYGLLFNSAAEEIKSSIYKDTYNRMLNLKPSFYSNNNYANLDVVINLENELLELEKYLSYRLAQLLKAITMIFSTIILLFLSDFSLLINLMMPLMAIFTFIILGTLKQSDVSMEDDKNSSFIFGLFALISPISVTIYFGGHELLNHMISLGDLTAFTLYLIFLLLALIHAIRAIQKLKSIKPALKIIKQIKKHSSFFPDKDLISINKIYNEISFKNLSFAYQNQIIPAIKQINFTIKIGQKIGIIGNENSGKRTLVELLLGFYQAPRSTIFLDDNDILDINNSSLQKLFAYAPRDNFLFSESIESNIKLGDSEAKDKKLLYYSKLTASSLNIESLTNYHKIIGQNFTPSQKQAQSINLTRALIKNAEVLIVDSCFDQLDAEINPLQHLKEELKDKTLIVITNNPRVTENCDLILVLDKGRIVQSGSHEELLAFCPYYQNFYQSQK